jgi:hypothetical protein
MGVYLTVITSDDISQLIRLAPAHIRQVDKRLATNGVPPHLSEIEMSRVHEQVKSVGYGQAPDLDDDDDVPRALPQSKRTPATNQVSRTRVSTQALGRDWART